MDSTSTLVPAPFYGESAAGKTKTINDLPTEILWYIFLTICLSFPGTVFSNMDVIQYPHVFTTVCSRWREIAFTNSTLWTVVQGVLRDTEQGYDDLAVLVSRQRRVVKGLHEHIRRSETQPLHVKLTIRYLGFDEHMKLINCLVSQCHRWKSLDLSIKDFVDSGEVLSCLQPIRNKLPLLEDLRIDWGGFSATLQGSVMEVKEGLFSSPSAPRLRNVAISGVSLDLPWKQLTSFSSDCRFESIGNDLYLTPHQLYSSTQLTHLSIKAYHHDLTGASLSDHGMLTLPGLRSLELSRVHPNIFRILQLPSLETLRFGDRSSLRRQDCFRDDVDYAPLVQFLDRSSCRLLSLSIPLPIEEADLLHIVFLSPKLKTLVVALLMSPGDMVWQALTGLAELSTLYMVLIPPGISFTQHYTLRAKVNRDLFRQAYSFEEFEARDLWKACKAISNFLGMQPTRKLQLVLPENLLSKLDAVYNHRLPISILDSAPTMGRWATISPYTALWPTAVFHPFPYPPPLFCRESSAIPWAPITFPSLYANEARSLPFCEYYLGQQFLDGFTGERRKDIKSDD